MARRRKPSGRKDGRPLGERQVNVRPMRPKYLIVCEGARTERNYFKRFRVNADVIDLDVRGLGDNTLSLVSRTCEIMTEDEYAQTWCVFDRDSFPAERFNDALALPKRSDIRVAYSNEAFELWYLLHFHYHDSATSRDLYEQMLSQRLGIPYRKNDPHMYRLLEDRTHIAIQNAERLLTWYGDAHNPEKDNPCTTVHELVRELLR